MIKKKTTEDIFNKCITLSKTSVDLGIDENYELKNCRDLWKKEVWISEDSILKLLMKWELKCLEYPHNTPRDLYFQFCRKELEKVKKDEN